jgi:hypothetical protein
MVLRQSPRLTEIIKYHTVLWTNCLNELVGDARFPMERCPLGKSTAIQYEGVNTMAVISKIKEDSDVSYEQQHCQPWSEYPHCKNESR